MKLYFINKRVKKLFIYLFIFFFISPKIIAQNIPIIVISPGKTEQSLNNIGTNINIIDKKTILESSNEFLGDIIDSNSSSINMFQSGGSGNVMGIQLRGLEKRYSTVYIDGVKMSDPSTPDNSFYFQNILKENIERVEILKGNQSTLYGPNAIGGTIHIFTKKGRSGQKPSFSTQLGSNKSRSFNYSIGGADEIKNYFLGLSTYSTDGISSRNDDTENDSYKNKTINSNLNFKLANDYEIRSSLRHVISNLNYDEVNKSLSDLNNSSNDTESSYSLKFIADKNNLKHQVNYNKTYIERKTLETGGKQNYFGYRDLINWIGTYNLNLDNRIVFGSDLELDAARYNGDYAPSANNWKKIFMDKFADENIHSIYFDYQFRPFENLYTTFGLRSDEHTSSGRKSSGRTTFLIKLDEKSRIRSSYGSGIRFPSLYDLHFADGNTNASGGGTYQNDGYLGLTVEDLKPERANSFDIGYAKDLSELNLKLDINYFYIEQKNPLNSDSRNNWKLQNTMGLNTSKGIELELGLKPQNSKVGFDLAYTFTDSYDSNTCSNDITSSRGCNIKSNKLGSAKVRVPRNILNTTFYYNPSSFFKNTIKFKFVDERRDFGDVNNDFKDIILDDYITVDFSSQFSLFPNYDLFFLAKNLFDTNYEQSNGYSSLGRSFFLGIKNVY